MTGDPTAQGMSESAQLVDPAEFAGMVRDATDDQLREGFATNRKLILDEVFRRMGHHLRVQAAADVEAVVEWRILGGAGGNPDRWQVVIRDGACAVVPEGEEEPRVAFTLDPVDFVRLVTGNASGPRLFMFGRLKVEGDLMLAARMPSLFSIPRA